jgi:HK97 gp10 family phage protein
MANSLADGALYFTGLSLGVERATKKAVTKACMVIRDEAKRVLGTYDYGWPSLAESTIERKETGDSPGLETGAMRKSITYSVDGTRMNWVGTIGTSDPHALFFELGTIHQPPRSFLGGAAMAKERKVKRILGHDFCHNIFSHSPDHEDDWSYDGED